MRKNIGLMLLTATLGLGGVAAASGPFDIVYIFNADGSYKGKGTYDGPGADGSRWACTVGSSSCDYCSVCHTPAQTEDRSYVAKYNAVRHRTVHLPPLTVPLSAGQKLPWGTKAYLSLRNSEVAASLNSGKDVAVFPAGSRIFLNRLKQPQLIALPPSTEPKIVP